MYILCVLKLVEEGIKQCTRQALIAKILDIQRKALNAGDLSNKAKAFTSAVSNIFILSTPVLRNIYIYIVYKSRISKELIILLLISGLVIRDFKAKLRFIQWRTSSHYQFRFPSYKEQF